MKKIKISVNEAADLKIEYDENQLKFFEELR